MRYDIYIYIYIYIYVIRRLQVKPRWEYNIKKVLKLLWKEAEFIYLAQIRNIRAMRSS